MTLAQPARSGMLPRRMHLVFALVAALTVVAFWKPYFALLGNLPDTMTVTVHVHGAMMFLWIAMLVAQAWLVRARRMRLHRAVGNASFVVVPLIVLTGLATIRGQLVRDPAEAVSQDARTDVFTFGMLATFVLCWALALKHRRRVDLHVRYILSTAFAIAPAIVFRVIYFWILGVDPTDPNGPEGGVAVFDLAVFWNGVVILTLLLALIVRDWRNGIRRSPFWVVTVAQTVIHVGYWTFGETETWVDLCRRFAGLGP